MTEMRKRTIGSTILMAAYLALPVAGRATEASVSADTYISQSNGTLNFGAQPTLSVSPGNTALIQLDLSVLQTLGLTASAIQRATLTVYVDQVLSPGSVDLAEVTAPWTESTVTYNAAPATAVPLSVDTNIAIAQAGYVTLDITAIVQNWLVNGHANNGVAISVDAANPNTSLLIDSKENTATSHSAFLDAMLSGGALAGDVTGTMAASVVATVGGSTAAKIHAAELSANAATATPTPNTIPMSGADGTLAPGWLPATLSSLTGVSNCTAQPLQYSVAAHTAPCVSPAGSSAALPIVATNYPGADIGAQVNAAIATYGAAPACGAVMIPEGAYTYSTPIDLSGRTGCDLFGLSMYATALTFTGTGKALQVLYPPANTNLIESSRVHDLRIACSGCADDGIYLQAPEIFELSRLTVTGFPASKGAIHLDRDSSKATNPLVFGIAIHNNVISGNQGHGLLIDGGDNGTAVAVYDNQFWLNQGNGLNVANRVQGLTVQNNAFYGNTSNQILIEGMQGGSLSGNMIQGVGSVIPVLFNSIPSAGVSVSGNFIGTISATYCLSLDGGLHTGISITGNNCANAAHGYYTNSVVDGVIGPNAGTTDVVDTGNSVDALIDSTGFHSVINGAQQSPTAGIDSPAFQICITAGCGLEVSATRYPISATGGASLVDCGFNLAIPPTGSSVIVDIQTAAGASIFGPTKLVFPVTGAATTVIHQTKFSQMPLPQDTLLKAVVLQNDSNGVAQFGYVKCH